MDRYEQQTISGKILAILGLASLAFYIIFAFIRISFVYFVISQISLIISFVLFPISLIIFIVRAVEKGKEQRAKNNTTKNEARNMTELAIAIAKGYPRLSKHDLSEKLGIATIEAERLFLMLISKNKIKGHFDSATGDFISTMATPAQMGTGMQGFHCPHCGASITSAPVKGTSTKCKSCGEIIVVT